jgi:hypothetical protein
MDRVELWTGIESGRSSRALASWRRLWDRWKLFAHVVGDFQARLILAIIYCFIVSPYAILVRLFSDPLNIRRPKQTSMWITGGQDEPTIAKARRQF